MEPKDLLDKINSEIKSAIGDYKSEFDETKKSNKEFCETVKSIEAKVSELEKKEINLATIPAYKKISEELDGAILEIKKMKEKGGEISTKKSVVMQFQDALKKNKDAIKLALKEKRPFDLELKTPQDITEANTVLSGSSANSLTEFSGIVSEPRRRLLKYSQQVSIGNISNRIAYWFEGTDGSGAPAVTAEGAAKNKVYAKWVEKTQRVEKITAYGKMSTEWMDDLPQMTSYFQNNILRRLDVAIEDQLFSGTGATGQILGAAQNAVTYTGGSLNNTVTAPSIADVFRGLALQVAEHNGQATCVFVRPGIIAGMDVSKSTTNEPVFPLWAQNYNIRGMQLVETMGIPAGLDFIGGDVKALNLLFRNSLDVRMVESGDDSINNLVTILAEQRLVQFISSNDYQLIIKGTIAAAKTALDVL